MSPTKIKCRRERRVTTLGTVVEFAFPYIPKHWSVSSNTTINRRSEESMEPDWNVGRHKKTGLESSGSCVSLKFVCWSSNTQYLRTRLYLRIGPLRRRWLSSRWQLSPYKEGSWMYPKDTRGIRPQRHGHGSTGPEGSHLRVMETLREAKPMTREPPELWGNF